MELSVALCQVKPVPGSPFVNAGLIAEAMDSVEADVFVFPEMFLNGYGAPMDYPEDMVDAPVGLLSDHCRKTDKAVCFGTPRFSDEGTFNSLAFLSPDGDTFYDKAHLASFGIYAEDGYVPGKAPTMGSYHGVRFGMCICYDIFFPEILHGCSLNGASVNICAAASAVQSKPFLDTVLPARALEDVTYTAYVNNVGEMNGCEMHGCSRGLDPFGRTIAECGTEERIEVMHVDTDALAEAREVRRHLEDYRSDIDWGVRGPIVNPLRP